MLTFRTEVSSKSGGKICIFLERSARKNDISEVGNVKLKMGRDWALNPPKNFSKCMKRVKLFYINLNLDQVSSSSNYIVLCYCFPKKNCAGGHVWKPVM